MGGKTLETIVDILMGFVVWLGNYLLPRRVKNWAVKHTWVLIITKILVFILALAILGGITFLLVYVFTLISNNA